MHPLNKKKMMKEKFEKRRQEISEENKKIVLFKDLDIVLEPGTLEWYQMRNRGGADLE